MNLEQRSLASRIVTAVTVAASLLAVAWEIRQNNGTLQLDTGAVQVAAHHPSLEQIENAWLQPATTDPLVRSPSGHLPQNGTASMRASCLLSATLFGHAIAMHRARRDPSDPELRAGMPGNNRACLGAEANLVLRERPGPLARQPLAGLTSRTRG